MSKAKGYFRSHRGFFFFFTIISWKCSFASFVAKSQKRRTCLIFFFCLAYLKQTVNNQVVVWLQIKVQ